MQQPDHWLIRKVKAVDALSMLAPSSSTAVMKLPARQTYRSHLYKYLYKYS